MKNIISKKTPNDQIFCLKKVGLDKKRISAYNE
jgi:hypothetical protein